MPKPGNAPARIPTCHPDRRHLAKGLCKPCYDKARASRDRVADNAKKRAWARANPRRVSAARIKYRYGIDLPTVAARFNAQDGKCRICLDAPAEHIDHNHATGQARGLLCGNCNRGLGLLREDRDRLRRAIQYLDLWEPPMPNTGEPIGRSTRGLS